jgi:uncharacterized protein (TIGR02147 family)
MLRSVKCFRMSVYAHQNYRTYLREVMAEKTRKNPAYSLRAMAKNLEIAPSFLSGVLKGRKNLSQKTSLEVARKLRLDEEEGEYFCLLAQKDAARDPDLKESLVARLQRRNPAHEVNDLSVDHFRSISDWQHFAILSATEMEGFEANGRNLASALEMPQAEIEVALDRLERLGMVEQDERGCWLKTSSNPRVTSKAPSAALRNFHRQTLAKAIESLETQGNDEKVVGSETFAFDSSQVAELSRLAEEFFDKALALAKKSKKRDCVYHLGVQAYNFTPSRRKK